MNMLILWLIIGYVVGFILTLLFFAKFGKKLGFDYDPPHDDWYDDYSSNKQAYVSFSIFWPFMWICGLFAGIWWLFMRFADVIIVDSEFSSPPKIKKPIKNQNILTVNKPND